MRLSDLYLTSQMPVRLGLAENVPMDKQATHAIVMSVSISMYWMDELILKSAEPSVDKCAHCFRPASREGYLYCTSRMSNQIPKGTLAEVRKMPAAGMVVETRRLKAPYVARLVRFPNGCLLLCELSLILL